VLSLAKLRVSDIYLPLGEVNMLSSAQILTQVRVWMMDVYIRTCI
jgi:hypothetical protein